MSKAKRPKTIRLGDYSCSPVRSRTSARGTTEWYWWVRLRKRGEKGEWTIGWCVDRDAATEKAMALLVELATARRPSVAVGSETLTAAIEAYHDAVEQMLNLRPNTRRLRQYAARQLLDWTHAEAGTLTCADFDEDQAGAYHRWLVRQDYKPSSVKAILTGARVFVRWAGRAWGVPDIRFPAVEVPPRTLRVPTTEEIERVLSVADEELAALVTLLAYSGLRASEALSRHWPDLDLGRGVLVVADREAFKPKTRDSYRVVGLSPACIGCDSRPGQKRSISDQKPGGSVLKPGSRPGLESRPVHRGTGAVGASGFGSGLHLDAPADDSGLRPADGARGRDGGGGEVHLPGPSPACLRWAAAGRSRGEGLPAGDGALHLHSDEGVSAGTPRGSARGVRQGEGAAFLTLLIGAAMGALRDRHRSPPS